MLKMHQITVRFLLIFLIFGFCLNCGAIRKMTAEGGAEFVVRMETNEPNKEEVYKRAFARMQNISNVLGAYLETERIPNSEDEFVVRIYKKEDTEQLKRLLFGDFFLEFRKVISPPAPSQYTIYSTPEAAKQTLEQNQEVMPFAKNKAGYIVVEKNNVITGNEIKDAKPVASTVTGEYSIQFWLNPEGARQLSEWTEVNLNNYIAVIINKNVVSVAAIQSRISDAGQISGRFSKNESENIAISLKSGQAAVKYQLLSEKTF